MATQIPQPIIHSYKEINPGKFKGVRHYELDQVNNGTPVFTDTINVSKDRKFARSNPDYWVKIREGKKWKNPALTGLFKTDFPCIFHGDSQKKTNLIIVIFTKGASEVKMYFFKDYYTYNFKAFNKRNR